MAPMPTFSSIWTQAFPPKPALTARSLPDLDGKVYIVTGSNTGVGKELALMLYSKNAKIYIAARSEQKAKLAIRDIEKSAPQSKGVLVFLPLDLSDLSTIKASVNKFTSQEQKLHVLFNNAGVQSLDGPKGYPKTAQGYEMNLGTNVVGTFLFTKLLTPTLVATAKSASPGTVRVVWVSSSGTELAGEKSVGVGLENLDYHIPKPAMERYALSKAGNWLHGVEFSQRHRADGIVSIPLNPGNLYSDLYRERGILAHLVLRCITYPSAYGASTELFAGLSPDVTLDRSGDWVVPFGRFHPIREDLVDATRTVAEGGNGHAAKFWDWTEDQIAKYL